MKKLEIDLMQVKQLGTTAAIVLAFVNKSNDRVSNADIAREIGITFPTAQKTLLSLAENGFIQSVGKQYEKIKNN